MERNHPQQPRRRAVPARQDRRRPSVWRCAILASAALTAALAVGVVSDTPPAAAATLSRSDAGGGAWVDGSGRLHVAIAPSGRNEPVKVVRHLARTDDLDVAYGNSGIRAFGGYPRLEDVGFMDDGTLVVVSMNEDSVEPLSHAEDELVIERFSLSGALLGRVRQPLYPGVWCYDEYAGDHRGCTGEDPEHPIIVGAIEVLDGGTVVVPTLDRYNSSATDGFNAYDPVSGSLVRSVALAAEPAGIERLGDDGYLVRHGTSSYSLVRSGVAPTGHSFPAGCTAGFLFPRTGGGLVQWCRLDGTIVISSIRADGGLEWTRTFPSSGPLPTAVSEAPGGQVLLMSRAFGGPVDLYRFAGTGDVAKIQVEATSSFGTPNSVHWLGGDVAAAVFGGGGGVETRVATLRSTPTVPAAPSAPVGVAGDQRVTVSWVAPGNGGSAITGYRITPYRDGVAQTPITVGNVTSRLITGLTNGVSYRFSVAAINAVGRGAESPLSVAVVPGVPPAAPTGVRASISGRSATVTWTAPPAVPGLPVLRYDMVVSADGVDLQTRDIGAGTSEVVPDLGVGVIYRFKVRAVNAFGVGPWSVLSNPVTPVRSPFASHGAAADRLSSELLGRLPTSAERAAWVPRLESGALTPGGLVAELRDGTDNLQRVDPVVRLYQAYFLRRPDAAGLTYWSAQRRAGRSLQSISDYFRRSGEFVALYGTLTNREFVELIYTNILGRPGEPGGVTHWTGELDSGRRSRGSVMVGFSEAAEYRNAQASEVDVSVLYILLLGRTPTAAEYAADVAALDAATLTVTALADRLIATPDYAART